MTDPVPPHARPPDTEPGATLDVVRRLLVIACSSRKRKDAGPLTAIERYDGPAFRVLRKFLAGATALPDVLVLSARFGLVPSDREIPDYDVRMTLERAGEVRAEVLWALGEAVTRGG